MRHPRRLAAVLYWLLLAGYAGLIFWLSSLGSSELPDFLGLVWDKLLHAVSYALLAMLFLLALNGGWRRRTLRRGAMAGTLLFVLAYGLTDEWHQYGVATRTASAADLLADLLGGIIGVLAYRLLPVLHRNLFGSRMLDHS